MSMCMLRGSTRRLVGGGQPRPVGGAALGGTPRDARVVRRTLALVGAPGCIRSQPGCIRLQTGCMEVPPQGCWHAAAHVKGGWSHVDRRTVRSWRSVRPRHSHAPEAPGAMVALQAWDGMGWKPGLHGVAAWDACGCSLGCIGFQRGVAGLVALRLASARGAAAARLPPCHAAHRLRRRHGRHLGCRRLRIHFGRRRGRCRRLRRRLPCHHRLRRRRHLRRRRAARLGRAGIPQRGIAALACLEVARRLLAQRVRRAASPSPTALRSGTFRRGGAARTTRATRARLAAAALLSARA
eukprot:scaffold58849_cov70-Phaeocystis_antarctica.AAC.11